MHTYSAFVVAGGERRMISYGTRRKIFTGVLIADNGCGDDSF